jgi:hypothetical protein
VRTGDAWCLFFFVSEYGDFERCVVSVGWLFLTRTPQRSRRVYGVGSKAKLKYQLPFHVPLAYSTPYQKLLVPSRQWITIGPYSELYLTCSKNVMKLKPKV